MTEIAPGDVDGIRSIANEWIEGRLDKLQLDGVADISLKSGIFPLGTHTVSESLVFEGQSLYQSLASLSLGRKGLLWLIETNPGLVITWLNKVLIV